MILNNSSLVYFLLDDAKHHKLICTKAIIEGDLQLLIRLHKLRFKFNNNNLIMSKAGKRGYKHLVDFLQIEDVKNCDIGLACAARGGHKNLIIFFREKNS